MNQKNQLNPFRTGTEQAGTLVEIEQSRAIQEVQAAMVIAKKFPRDEAVAMDRILKTCTRTALADKAMYAFPRGKELVTGPSIRLAEAIAQNWGNIQFGIRELEQVEGNSTVEAFAWDLETNTRQAKVFQVAHIRSTRNGNKKLTDPRDIYEMTANQGARRLRSCILGVIPGDVIDVAVRQCEITLASNSGTTEEAMKKVIEHFAKVCVTPEMIEKRLGHNIAATTQTEIVNLRKIYRSLRDNMAKVEDFFGPGAGKPEVDIPVGKSETAVSDSTQEASPTYAEIAKYLNDASTANEADEAATFIGEIKDEKQRQELIDLYDKCRSEIDNNE